MVAMLSYCAPGIDHELSTTVFFHKAREMGSMSHASNGYRPALSQVPMLSYRIIEPWGMPPRNDPKYVD